MSDYPVEQKWTYFALGVTVNRLRAPLHSIYWAFKAFARSLEETDPSVRYSTNLLLRELADRVLEGRQEVLDQEAAVEADRTLMWELSESGEWP